MRELIKTVAHGIATICVVPSLISYWVRASIIGADRALQGSTQALSLVPGVAGQYLRRAFLARVLAHCSRKAAIEFGAVFSHAQARVDERAYVGPNCSIGFAHIEHDVLLGPRVQVLSGARTHASDDPDVPIRDQAVQRTLVRIGHGAWIGAGAIIMADVGADAIVGAGAVVTSPIPERVVAAGVPAKVLRAR